jgi:hypothetical protein
VLTPSENTIAASREKRSQKSVVDDLSAGLFSKEEPGPDGDSPLQSVEHILGVKRGENPPIYCVRLARSVDLFWLTANEPITHPAGSHHLTTFQVAAEHDGFHPSFVWFSYGGGRRC